MRTICISVAVVLIAAACVVADASVGPTYYALQVDPGTITIDGKGDDSGWTPPLWNPTNAIATEAKVSSEDPGRHEDSAEDTIGSGSAVLFFDDFGDGNDNDWTGVAGNWGSVNGEYVMQSTPVSITRSYNSVTASAYAVEADIRFYALEGKLIYCKANEHEGYRVDLMDNNDDVRLIANGLYHFYTPVSQGVTYHLKVEVTASRVKVWLNEALIHDVATNVPVDGSFGVGTYGPESYTNQGYFDNIKVTVVDAPPPPGTVVANEVADADQGPVTFALWPNKPNPFNAQTFIRYQLPAAGIVRIAIYNSAGQLTREVVNGEHPPGLFETQWDGKDDRGRAAASGLYLYRLQIPGYQRTRQMLLLR